MTIPAIEKSLEEAHGNIHELKKAITSVEQNLEELREQLDLDRPARAELAAPTSAPRR